MGAFYFLVKVLACGHSATPSAAAGGVLGVVGGSKAKTVINCFCRSETAQSNELKKGAGRPTRNDFATVEGNASSFSIYYSDLTG